MANKAIDLVGLSRFLKNLEDKVCVHTSYENLVSLRDNGGLVVGSYYRITDYVTTTAQENTQSAGHPFDVIVLALSENTLAEEAYAIQSARDTDGYFANSNLAAWQIWYCLDNDAERFAWADAENGKGVIYRMIDEWGNDVPYDFKNIMFKRQSLSKVSLLGETDNITASRRVTFMNSYLSRNAIKYCVHSPDQDWGGGVVAVAGSEMLYFYTFSEKTGGIISDHSLRDVTHKNTIKPYWIDKNILNNNIFIHSSASDICSCNMLGADCYENTFGANTYKNTFDGAFYNNIVCDNVVETYAKTYCRGNVIGNECTTNVLGCHNHYITLCDDSYSNVFDNYCHYISLDYGCYFNKFLIRCNRITLGYDSRNILFGNNCANIVIGTANANHSFENFCTEITTDNNNRNHYFGNQCTSIDIGLDCRYSRFEEYCTNIHIGASCLNNTFHSGCMEITIGSSSSNNAFENSCNDITLGNGCSNNRFAIKCSQIKLARQSSGNSFGNQCTNITLGEYCRYNTFGVHCQYIYFKMANATDAADRPYLQSNVFASGSCYILLWDSRTSSAAYTVQNFVLSLVGSSTSYHALNMSGKEKRLYQTTVAVDSSGNVKQFCIADTIQ